MDWKQMYEQKFNDSAAGYEEQKKSYENAMTAEQNALKNQRDTSAASAKQNMEDVSRQAYVSKAMADKNMQQRLTMQGVSGGMSETTASNIFKDYLNSKNSANTAYNKAVTDIDNNFAENSAKIKTSWTQKMAELDQQRRAQALEQAKMAYQVYVEEEQRRKEEEERQRHAAEEERQRRAAAAARKNSSKKASNKSATPKLVSKTKIPTGQTAYKWSDGKITYSSNYYSTSSR